MHSEGERVIAIAYSEGNTIYYYGEGTYIGYLPIPDAVNPMFAGIDNPCILLANGKSVWGMECWWGNVEKAKKVYAKYEWKLIDIDERRQQVIEENKAHGDE